MISGYLILGNGYPISTNWYRLSVNRDEKMEERLNQNCSSKEEEEGITTTRIFVGGLGETVTSDDINKMLSSLGTVKVVDIVRTKGRSFAYLDFLPSSAKSLSKLFSTYNGCFWKGGRLKLEKAKEHYLVRLSREWAEDGELAISQPSNSIDKNTNIVSSDKLKKTVNQEKSQLRIFFPKLRKMKSLPFSGTGKHKYSFQRIEVPSLPTHFCDCEEHSGPPHIAQKQYFCDPEPQSGGMNKDELNMMNSVMNKIFERETDLKVAYNVTGLTKGGHDSLKSTNERLIDDNESDHAADEDELRVDGNESDLAEDEDNLVINMFTGRHRMALLGSQEQEAISMNQKSRFNDTWTSTDGPAPITLPSTKKRKSLHIDESDGNEFLSAIPGKKPSLQTHSNDSGVQSGAQTSELRPGIQKTTANLSWSQKSSWRELVGDKGNNPFIISDMLPGVGSRKQEQVKSDGRNVHDIIDSKKQNLVNYENLEAQSGKLKGLEGLAEAQPPIPDGVVKSSGRGASWLQKSSWTQLVSEANTSSFSISQILPGIPFEKQKLPKFSDVDLAVSSGSKHHDQVKPHTSETIRDGNEKLEVGKGFTTTSSSDMVALDEEHNFVDLDVEKSTPEKGVQMIGNNEVSARTLRKKPHIGPKQTSIKDVKIGETCSFMRTAASVKEWSKTKAALSGSLKKKNNENAMNS